MWMIKGHNVSHTQQFFLLKISLPPLFLVLNHHFTVKFTKRENNLKKKYFKYVRFRSIF